jgi:transketolase
VFGDSDDPPRIAKLAVRELPGSATPEQQLAAAGIDAEHIADAARRLVAGELIGVGAGQEGRK